MDPSLYDFEALDIAGKPVPLAQFKGRPLLIVNTASACGFTPQFAGLEELHKAYADKGLVVLGFPCNQFGRQDPGSNEEIGAFCQKNYGVSFQMMEKIDVNGSGAHHVGHGLAGLVAKAIVQDLQPFDAVDAKASEVLPGLAPGR